MEPEHTSTGQTQDERILAALAHGSILLPLWGLIGAVIIWVTQREKSRFIRFQALQATVYQIVLILSWFAGGACYMCSFFGMFSIMMPLGIMGAGSTTEVSTASGPLAMLTFFVPFLIMGSVMLLSLALVVYGLCGAVRVLQGHDFRYAIVGRKLEEYLSRGKTET